MNVAIFANFCQVDFRLGINCRSSIHQRWRRGRFQTCPYEEKFPSPCGGGVRVGM